MCGFLFESDFDFDIWNVIGFVLQVWLPSPEGETNITPGDRARQGEGTRGRLPPKISARRALYENSQSFRKHASSILYPFLSMNGRTSSAKLIRALAGAGRGGSLYPGLRRAPRSSPGVMFVSPYGLGRALVWIVIFWSRRSTGAKCGSRVRDYQ